MDIGIEIGRSSSFVLRKTVKKAIVVFLFVLIIAALIVSRVQLKYNSRIQNDFSKIEKAPAVIVFGAGLRAKGQPSAILEDRILMGIKLYQEGKVDKVIMSGDNSTLNHNEVQAMKNFAISEGLPESAIEEDHAGTSTLASCRNAKNNYAKVILVTQKYHLRRALFLCNEIGIDAVGVPADSRIFMGKYKYFFRELVASFVAYLQVLF